MNWLLYTSIVLFTVYIAWMVLKYGIPDSISETFYILEERKKGLGWIFTTWCWAVSFTLFPYWVEISSENTQFLPFFAAFGLCLVGVAPQFKEEGTVRKLHFIGASASGVCSILALCLSGLWIYPLFAAPITAYFIYTNKREWLFWIEMGAFISTYSALILNI
jgi:4-amino-4-deoxy-L-arabinose transferase-like glycosyltransferase